MNQKIVSLKQIKYEKQYKLYYSDINNYNRSLAMVGTAPKSTYEIKRAAKIV